MKCEARREKPSRYLGTRNLTGRTYQKCGRKAVDVSEFGKPLCRKCKAKELPSTTPTEEPQG